MDQASLDNKRKRTRTLIEKMSLEELSYTLGRYCGKSNSLLCEKKYGFVLDEKIVRKELETREFEDAIFGTEG